MKAQEQTVAERLEVEKQDCRNRSDVADDSGDVLWNR